MPADFVFNRSVVRTNLRLDPPRTPFKIAVDADYDITARTVRYSALTVAYDYQCFVFTGELKVYSYFGRVETQFRLRMSLGNLGEAADFFRGKR